MKSNFLQRKKIKNAGDRRCIKYWANSLNLELQGPEYVAWNKRLRLSCALDAANRR